MPLLPDQLLATELASALSLTVGTDCFASPVLPPDDEVAHKAVFVLATGGPPPEGFMAGSALATRFASMQIRIRSDERKYTEGLVFARAVRDAVHYARPTGVKETLVQETEPNYLGEDEEEHHEWSINAVMTFEE